MAAPATASLGTVAVCGGGNAAHVAAGMYSHAGAAVRLFLSVPSEAAAWQAGGGAIEVRRRYQGDSYAGHVELASSDPSEVIPGASLVLIIVPAFAHRPILTAIGPHLSPGTIVLAMPAPGNFDLLARQVLGPKLDEVVLAGTVCLPWACRIEEYGRRVELLGEKSPVTLVARPSAASGRVVAAADALHDGSAFRAAAAFVQCTLFPTNPMLHPGVLYSFWSRWDGAPLAAKPVFYEGVDDFAASVLEGEDADIQAIRRALEASLGVSLPLPTLLEQMVEGYGDQISDASSYRAMLTTNVALAGLHHPVVWRDSSDSGGKGGGGDSSGKDGGDSSGGSSGGWVLDGKSRYLWEDVPHGLVAIKGLGQLLDVATPTIDKVLAWAQQQMGRAYLVGDRLDGADVASTAAPQAFGITTRAALLDELRRQLGGAATS